MKKTTLTLLLAAVVLAAATGCGEPLDEPVNMIEPGETTPEMPQNEAPGMPDTGEVDDELPADPGLPADDEAPADDSGV